MHQQTSIQKRYFMVHNDHALDDDIGYYNKFPSMNCLSKSSLILPCQKHHKKWPLVVLYVVLEVNSMNEINLTDSI